MSLADVQRRLAALDLYHGEPDGIWGAGTETPIAALLDVYADVMAIPSPEQDPQPPALAPLAGPVLQRNQWPTQAGAEGFYGAPGENLVQITPPYPMLWDLDPGDGRGRPVNYIRINRRCADSLLRCLKAILALYPNRADLEAKHLHWFAGSYAPRNIRGGHSTSMHAYGAAIDLAATWNAQHEFYDESKGMMPMKVVEIFEAEGWTWGGRWSPRSIDAMHFQSARVS